MIVCNMKTVDGRYITGGQTAIHICIISWRRTLSVSALTSLSLHSLSRDFSSNVTMFGKNLFARRQYY